MMLMMQLSPYIILPVFAFPSTRFHEGEKRRKGAEKSRTSISNLYFRATPTSSVRFDRSRSSYLCMNESVCERACELLNLHMMMSRVNGRKESVYFLLTTHLSLTMKKEEEELLFLPYTIIWIRPNMEEMNKEKTFWRLTNKPLNRACCSTHTPNS